MNILITGVSSGIGHGLARELLDQGNTVYGVSRRTPRGLEHPRFHFGALDLARFDDIAPAMHELVPSGTMLDLVVLNAGVLGEIRDLAKTSLTDLRWVMDVNVWSAKVFLDALWAHGVTTASVIGISSGAAVKGHRGWGAYAVSKAALNMLIQVYAVERPDVHFLALAPGLVDTGMQEYMRTLPDTPEYASVKRLKEAHGTPNMPDPTTFAKRLVELLPGLKNQPTGSFVDVRNL